MSIQQERLRSLIEFAQHTARLRTRLVTDAAQYAIFHAHEQDICDLPGLSLGGPDDGSDVWLSVERMQETPAPEPVDGLLRVWLELPNDPGSEPALKMQVTAQTLRSVGALPLSKDNDAFHPEQIILFSAFDRQAQVESEFKIYLEKIWLPWSREEKQRRRAIALYAGLFTLKQQLEGAIVDSPIELVWGAGISVCLTAGAKLTYPLLTQPVELSLDETTMALEIRPRDVDTQLELDFFSATHNPGVAVLGKAAVDFFKNAPSAFSPFDRSTFEPLLRTAVAYLDPAGIYWPHQTSTDDRSLPPADEHLKMTDTWLLFARPRSANLFIQDLSRFQSQIDNALSLPKALLALLTDPSTAHREPVLPAYRGLSKIAGTERPDTGGIDAVQELYFPEAFNDEQVQIVQKLQVYDGVVVQGPPGTGKTHTIANIICHYLALGRRVLVTSMKEPALNVLKEKLPGPIQSLVISLLTTERDGMKQFEHSIAKIASELQSIDRPALAREIVQIKAAIDICHARLARTDAQINEWAMKNLRPVDLDGELIEPQAAAAEMAAHKSVLRLDDPISIGAEFRPQFTDDDIAELGKVRKAVGQDLDYLAARLPELADFPDSKELLRSHGDLSRHRELQSQIETGDIPALGDNSDATLTATQALFDQISSLKELRISIKNTSFPWTAAMLSRLRKERTNEILGLFEALAEALDREILKRRQFLAKPVELADDDDDRNEMLLSAVQRCAEGKMPFGITGLLLGAAEKFRLKAIRIDGHPPVGSGDWRHILDFVYHRRTLRTLITRWNNLAAEFGLPCFPVAPNQAVILAENLGHYRKLDAMVTLENDIAANAASVLPSWSEQENLSDNDEALAGLQNILRHHLTRQRLSDTWAVKERFQHILSGCTGRITLLIKDFIDHTLGDPALGDAELQRQWSALMEDLRRVQGLGNFFDTVRTVTRLIADSGAPHWAERLRSEPAASQGDEVLPEDWRTCWRINRLANYLESIDARAELKQLAAVRFNLEAEQARSYREAVVKQTWLKLAENASPSVKSALQAYLSAIKKIGKRKGKRVPLYQRQAREAAALAGPAVPCWIMPHYRISESLPAEFGSFDLVIIDEASQSDLSALPAIFRAQKILVVGDDKQVSPEGAFLDTAAIQNLVQRYLVNQFPLYRDQMTPERSIYDLFRVVFADSATMLKEHFRCVAPIIEYSKREVYKHELKPLRIPKASERLDPPLIDVMVEDGCRESGEDINLGEAVYIVDEIKRIVQDPALTNRTIGVVSLLGDKQTLKIWEMLNDDDLDEWGQPKGLSPDVIERHKITCGDARTFQGKERDIMFLSMVVSKGNASALARETFVQRFNVAASRARDRMYLVRSIAAEDLSRADTLRRNLIAHFQMPFARDEIRVENLRALCETDFERALYDLLTERGYRVIPQLRFGGGIGVSTQFCIDMVVEGSRDKRLAVECDGDRYHGADRWEDDMRRQRILERAGWRFWRCFASAFIINREAVTADLINTLTDMSIEPFGAESVTLNGHTELRRFTAFPITFNEAVSPKETENS